MYDNGNYVSRLNSPGSNQTLYRESSGNLGEFVFSLSNSYLDRVYFGLGLGLLILEYQQVDSYHENNFLDSLSPLNDFAFNNKLEITKKLNHVLEEMITKNPNQWIWTHDRWK